MGMDEVHMHEFGDAMASGAPALEQLVQGGGAFLRMRVVQKDPAPAGTVGQKPGVGRVGVYHRIDASDRAEDRTLFVGRGAHRAGEQRQGRGAGQARLLDVHRALQNLRDAHNAGTRQYIPNNSHWNVPGNVTMADVLADYIKTGNI